MHDDGGDLNFWRHQDPPLPVQSSLQTEATRTSKCQQRTTAVIPAKNEQDALHRMLRKHLIKRTNSDHHQKSQNDYLSMLTSAIVEWLLNGNAGSDEISIWVTLQIIDEIITATK